MAELLLGLRGHLNIQHLNLAFNPLSATQEVKALCQFIQINISLQHMDLSGVLQASLQVQKVVKRIAKSSSILSVHLSHTDCIRSDPHLRKYIMKKLRINENEFERFNADDVAPKEKDSSSRENQLARAKEREAHINTVYNSEKKDWMQQYEHTLASKMHLREKAYYEDQAFRPSEEMKSHNTFVLQRTLAHPEITGNGKWHVSTDECFVCDRWQYTIVYGRGRKDNLDQTVVPAMSSSFKLLNNSKVDLVDVRELARRVVENSGDPELDREQYWATWNEQKRAAMTEVPEQVQKFKRRFTDRDLSLYQEDCGDGIPVFQRVILNDGRGKKNIQFVAVPGETKRLKDLCKDYLKDPEAGLYVFADFMKAHSNVQTLTIVK